MKRRKQYQHVFFDLDATLWDFDRCSAEVLRHLFVVFRLNELEGLTADRFVEEYRNVTFLFWAMYRNKKITKETIREKRFLKTLKNLGYEYSPDFDGIEDAYLDLCPRKPHVMPHAHQVLETLSDQYALHIITNGFSDTQQIKMEASQLTPYFHCIVTSDCGYHKPDGRMFELALKQACCKPEEALMIGDSLEADIAGARDARIDQVYYNPHKIVHNEPVTHEIGCLRELLVILNAGKSSLTA